MKTSGNNDLQEKYKYHHIEDECTGVWKAVTGHDMPYKVEDGINIVLVNPPLVRCEKCQAQFFEDGFEKRMLRHLAHMMILSHRPLDASQIRFTRSLAGLTQSEVAEEFGIRKEAISRYESRKDPHTMQPGDQVRFKLLLIAKLGFEIPKGAELWKADKASVATEVIRKIDAARLEAV